MFIQAEKKSIYFSRLALSSKFKPNRIFCRTLQRASRLVAASHLRGRGKSGQHRAPYFLTGRISVGDDRKTDRATETNRQSMSRACLSLSYGKGEKVG